MVKANECATTRRQLFYVARGFTDEHLGRGEWLAVTVAIRLDDVIDPLAEAVVVLPRRRRRLRSSKAIGLTRPRG